MLNSLRCTRFTKESKNGYSKCCRVRKMRPPCPDVDHEILVESDLEGIDTFDRIVCRLVDKIRFVNCGCQKRNNVCILFASRLFPRDLRRDILMEFSSNAHQLLPLA